MNRTLALLTIALVAVALVGGATGRAADGFIHACAEPFGDGSAPTAGRMHRSADGACPAGWRALSWRSRGTPGPAGFAGPPGADAEPGPRGPGGPLGPDAVGAVDETNLDIVYRPQTGKVSLGGFEVACPAGYSPIGAGYDALDNTSFGEMMYAPISQNGREGVEFRRNRSEPLPGRLSASPICLRSR